MIIHRPPKKKSYLFERLKYEIAQELHHKPYSLCTAIQKQLVDEVIRERNDTARSYYHISYVNCSDTQKEYIKDHS